MLGDLLVWTCVRGQYHIGPSDFFAFGNFRKSEKRTGRSVDTSTGGISQEIPVQNLNVHDP